MPLRPFAKTIWHNLSDYRRFQYYVLRAKLKGTPPLEPSEYYLVSYPKSGRTWLRCLIGRTFQTLFELDGANILEIEKFATCNPRIPQICATHDDNPMWKTPNELESSKAKYKNSKILFLVRDPRDTVVSLYFHRNRRKKTYSGTLSQFIREPRGGLDTIMTFLNTWADNRAVPRSFLLVRYEALRQDTAGQLRGVMGYLGFPNISDEIIQDAIDYCSFENMHKMEQSDALKSPKLRPKNQHDRHSFKTRQGVVGGYQQYYSPSEIEYLDKQVAEKLSPYFGYGTTRQNSNAQITHSPLSSIV